MPRLWKAGHLQAAPFHFHLTNTPKEHPRLLDQVGGEQSCLGPGHTLHPAAAEETAAASAAATTLAATTSAAATGTVL